MRIIGAKNDDNAKIIFDFYTPRCIKAFVRQNSNDNNAIYIKFEDKTMKSHLPSKSLKKIFIIIIKRGCCLIRKIKIFWVLFFYKYFRKNKSKIFV